MEKDVFEGMIDIAIEREKEAYNFYKEVAVNQSDKGLSDIFNELANEEKNHRNLLETLKRDENASFKFESLKTDYHLAEQTELPPLSINMKPVDAFALAMKKEQQAAEFYQDLAKRAQDEEIKQMCLNLARMELQHKQKIENAFVDIAYPEVF